ncbi:MAG TPA: LysM domain-containing protein [Mycobacteriales bacterium]|nr:LysM domain-containing protein [Mycobacteriales bacterium]
MANRGRRALGAVVCLAAAVAAGGLITWCRPDTVSVQPGDPTSGVVVACCWLAWLGVAYLSLATVAAALAYAPGELGRLGTTLAPLTPPALRRVVGAVVAVMAATGVLAGPAAADTPGPGPAVPAPTSVYPSLDWPGLAQPPTGAIVVHDGDSLWAISARLLRPDATTRQVAALWPRLYAANRAVIGPDPDLIHPGQRLRPTDQQKRTPR